MSMHVQQSRYNGEHQIGQARAISTTSLSVPTIIEIGVCGGVGLLGVLLSVLFFVARGKHKREKRKESLEELDEDSEIRRAIRSTCPPDLDLGRRRSYLPFFCNKKTTVSNQWVDEDELHGPRMAFTPGSEDKGYQNAIPLVPLQPPVLPHPQAISPESSFSPSDLYPVISPPRPPAIPQPSFTRGRTYDPVLGDEILDVAGISRSTIRHVPYEPQTLAMKRRSVSDNQLTSILRSTSQRMRERRAVQRPLSRAQSVLSQISGVPPSQRLPSPPQTKFGESGYGDSREGLIDTRDDSRRASEQSYETSNYEAVLENFPPGHTPSPSKPFPWSADHVTGKRISSPSGASDEDSLCNGKTPDLVIPFHLTSPSKRKPSILKDINGNERHSVRVYSGVNDGPKSAIQMSTRIRQDSRASIQALGYFDLAARQKHPLAESKEAENETDPFYSGNGERSIAKVNRILIGPRSLPVKAYMPKRCHSRNVSNISRLRLTESPTVSEAKLPLGDISGNSSQIFSEKQENNCKLDPQLANFQWSPEPMQLVARRTSVSSIGPGITKRQHQGHKRQNVVRISGLPRPRSVCPVPEESDDFNNEGTFSASKLDLSKVPSAPPLSRLHSSESLARSASLASMYSRYSTIDNMPPSSSVFEPRLTFLPPNGKIIHQSISITSMGSSPTLGSHHPNLISAGKTDHGSMHSSPSITANGSQTLEANECTDDFSGSPSKLKKFSKSKVRRMGRNFSIDYDPVDAKGSIFTFPSPLATTEGHSFSSANASPSPLNLSSVSPKSATYSQPVPSLLTRLHSPNSPQRLPNSSDHLLKNIAQLRRGNSSVSSYSLNSIGSGGLGETDENSTSVANLCGRGMTLSKRGTDSSRESYNNVNLSGPSSANSSPARRGREFPLLGPRLGVTSPSKTVTFEELGEGSSVGLGLDFPSSTTQHGYVKNEHKVFETIEQEPDTLTSTPSRKFKSIRKVTKSFPKLTSDPTSSALDEKSENDKWIERSKERSFEFENYSSRHFEGLVRFIDDDDDDDEDITTPEELEVDKTTSLSDESKATKQPPFQFQGQNAYTSNQYTTSGSFNDFSKILSTNLSTQNTVTKHGQGSGWDMYSNAKTALAPSPPTGMSTPLSVSPMQLSDIGNSKIPPNQPSTQGCSDTITKSPILPQSQYQNNKSIEILSPSPTSSSLSQILQNKRQELDILQVHYPKTSRWVWEETTPKVSPSPSPDRNSPGKRMYKAHSRNQSQSIGQGKHGDERKMGNPLSSNPTISTLMMEKELDMKEPKMIDLDEINNFPSPQPISTLNTPSVGGEKEADIEEDDIRGVPPTSLPSNSNDINETPKPKAGKKRSHLESMFSKHHKGEDGVDGMKRGSLYDQDGFLKSSPAQGAEIRRSRGWGVKGKR